jgi:hypothetical protein
VRILPEHRVLHRRRERQSDHAPRADLLLEHELLSTDEAIAARVWLGRERTEHEAAALFQGLSADLAAAGAPRALVELAVRCAEDERAHAIHCRAIVDALAPQLAPLAPDPHVALGPRDAAPARRALYTSVALGCVTESLSTALLIEIRKRAEHSVVRRALDVILEDEVRHARLGWAHLAHAAAEGDVRWLAPAIPAMIRAAIDDEAPAGIDRDLAPFGILARAEVARTAEQTIAETIVPGLAHHGIEAGKIGGVPA